MNILHRVEKNDTVKGHIKISWQHLDFDDDDRVDFEEFESELFSYLNLTSSRISQTIPKVISTCIYSADQHEEIFHGGGVVRDQTSILTC
jgi:hypothetical protein